MSSICLVICLVYMSHFVVYCLQGFHVCFKDWEQQYGKVYGYVLTAVCTSTVLITAISSIVPNFTNKGERTTLYKINKQKTSKIALL